MLSERGSPCQSRDQFLNKLKINIKLDKSILRQGWIETYEQNSSFSAVLEIRVYLLHAYHDRKSILSTETVNTSALKNTVISNWVHLTAWVRWKQTEIRITQKGDYIKWRLPVLWLRQHWEKWIICNRSPVAFSRRLFEYSTYLGETQQYQRCAIKLK